MSVRIEADTLSGTPGGEARAEGGVELRRGGLTVRADRVTYDALSEHEAFFAYVSTFETLASQFTRPTTSV